MAVFQGLAGDTYLLPELLPLNKSSSLEDPILPPSEDSPRNSDCMTITGDDDRSLKLTALVHRIHDGDDLAIEELYELMRNSVRFVLVRMVPMQEVEDRLHNTFLIVLTAIKKGQLQDPSKLLSYLWTVAQRQGFGHIGDAVKARKTFKPLDEAIHSIERKSYSPDASVILREQAEIFSIALNQLRPCEREILRRFYLEEQSEEVICAEMSLSGTQFRLNKSRAKAKLVAVGQRLMVTPRIPPGKAESLRTVRTPHAGGTQQMTMAARA